MTMMKLTLAATAALVASRTSVLACTITDMAVINTKTDEDPNCRSFVENLLKATAKHELEISTQFYGGFRRDRRSLHEKQQQQQPPQRLLGKSSSKEQEDKELATTGRNQNEERQLSPWCTFCCLYGSYCQWAGPTCPCARRLAEEEEAAAAPGERQLDPFGATTDLEVIHQLEDSFTQGPFWQHLPDISFMQGYIAHVEESAPNSKECQCLTDLDLYQDIVVFARYESY